MKEISITAIDDFKFGHAQDNEGITGCTVVLAENGAVAGVDVRGASPGTRETDLLQSENLVDNVHAVFLTGGSAYGLDVGSGIMKFLEEKNIGFDVQVAKVPIVTGAVLFDLIIGNSKIRPDGNMGHQACVNAQQTKQFSNGNVGAGTGATVGKCLGIDYAMKGGIGSYAIQVGELKIGAVVAVNSFGDIIDPNGNGVIAGLYDRKSKQFLHTEDQMVVQLNQSTNRFSGNTTLACVVTNAKLTKANANKIASIAHDGMARTMRPAHTFVDGDTVFTITSNRVEVDLNTVGFLAALVVERAIVKGVKTAESLSGFPGYKTITN